VGGGILGAGAALALAERGHDVVLQERDALGSAMTARAAGVLSTMTWHDDEYRLIAENRARIGEVISLAMIEGVPHARSAWRPEGSVLVARGDGLAALDDVQDRLERHSEEPERLGHREASAEFPSLAFFPGEEVLVAQEDGVIEAGDLFTVLRARLAAEGVAVEERREATLPVAGGSVTGHDAVVAAGGAWTAGLLRDAGIRLPLASFRTQLASLELPRGGSTPIVHDAVHGFYARPEAEDTVLAGDGTRLTPHDPETYDTNPDAAFREHVALGITRRFARGEEARWRAGWAGLCVGTPDRRPLCGRVPGVDGLFVLTGDNGFGLMRGLALGERLADAVGGRADPDLDPGRFGPEAPLRFPLREGFSL